ncbi:hypothetical protein HDV01_007836 [Terramyces sp. JEL0728]|nr:hypothetical protein HDV01_007836 [Terramyces sp. JEL0728]
MQAQTIIKSTANNNENVQQDSINATVSSGAKVIEAKFTNPTNLSSANEPPHSVESGVKSVQGRKLVENKPVLNSMPKESKEGFGETHVECISEVSVSGEDMDQETKKFWMDYLVDVESTDVSQHVVNQLPVYAQMNLTSLVNIDTLNQVTVTHNVEMVTVANAAWSCVLKTFFQREHAIFATMDGYKNIVPFKSTVNPHAVLSEWIQNLQNQAQVVKKHLAPLEAILDLTNLHDHVNSLVQYETGETFTEKFQILLHLISTNNSLDIKIEYNIKAIEPAFAQSMGDYFNQCLSWMCTSLLQNDHGLVSDILVLEPLQKAQVLAFGKGPLRDIHFDLGHLAFEKIAMHDPDLIAVEQDGRSITYGELNQQANQLAAALVGKGVQVGDFVAIVTIRSIEMIIGIFAVLKAGAAYVPIDSSLPLERIQYILETCNCPIVLYHEEIESSLFRSLSSTNKMVNLCSRKEVSSDQLPSVVLSSSDSAYCIFTSGSTGKPKGVVISHLSLCNCALNDICSFDLRRGTKIAQMASINFDVSVGEIFTALSNEATLVLRSNYDYYSVLDQVQVANLTPTAFAKIQPHQYPNLKRILLAGEMFNPSFADLWAGRLNLINSYGPTEATVISSSGSQIPGKRVHIGKPVPNSNQYIVDRELNLVPIGVPGELLIGGVCVAQEYLNRPDLTREKFIKNHFLNDGSKMYRTGDVCKWSEDGDIIMMGRKDDMVKIKGYRIELDEVSSALQRHPLVSAATVLVQQDQLFAYITPKVELSSVRDFISDILPHYMLPSVIIPLHELPMTPNGKIDKAVLRTLNVQAEFQKPETELEISLASLWADLLNVEQHKIGRYSSFFEFGGDSISAIQLVGQAKAIGLQLNTTMVFKKSLLLQMALCTVSESTRSEIKPIVVPEMIVEEINQQVEDSGSIEDMYPATPLQSGMIAKSMQNSKAYVNQMKLQLSQELDLDQLQHAVDQITRAHGILRTRFVSTSQGIYQVLQKQIDAFVEIQSSLEEYCCADLERGFDLHEVAWFRVAYINGAQPYLIFTIHHALYDGWCMDQIVESLFSAYSGNIIEQSGSFKSVVEYIESMDREKGKEFWNSYLSDVESSTGFGGNKSSQKDLVVDYEPHTFKVSASLSDMKLISSKYQITMATLAKAAWASTLKMFTQQDTVVFANIVSGRDIPVENVESIVGLLMNSIPFKANVNPEMNLLDWLRQLQENHTSTLDYSHSSLVDIYKWTSKSNLLKTSFVFENMPNNGDSSSESFVISNGPDANAGTFNEYEIQVVLFPTESGLDVEVEYDLSILDASFAQSIGDYFNQCLSWMCTSLLQNDHGLVSDILVLEPLQKAQVLAFGKGLLRDIRFDLGHLAFEKIAMHDPDLIAVEQDGRLITYGELNQQANQLAAALVGKGVQVGDFVAIVTIRSIEMIIGIFAVLKAGAAYVPIDSSLPLERIQYILETCNCPIVLYHEEIESSLFRSLSSTNKMVNLCSRKEVSSDQLPSVVLSSSDSAYCIFTSGSTGKPKGVVISHLSLCNCALNDICSFDLRRGTKIAQMASINFDASVGEIFTALSNEATLVLRSNYDYYSVLDQVQVANLTPTAFAKIQPHQYPNLKRILLAGEMFNPSFADLWAGRLNLINSYGPTEATVISSSGSQIPGKRVHIGKPVPNSNQYIVDRELNLVPIGVPGELLIGGVCVAQEYLNRPDLTREKFIKNHFLNDGSKMYRTGDVCKWTEDGDIQIMGRNDNMVKVKGYRIELDEVSSALQRHPLVSAATVIVKDGHLVGFVTPKVDINEVRGSLMEILPYYMVPSAIVSLNELPATTNGKIDKSALSSLDYRIEFALPTTEDEMNLASIWSKVLNVSLGKIGRDTSFFEIGGDSISVLQMCFKCKKLGWSLSSFDVFQAQTLSQMVKAKVDLKKKANYNTEIVGPVQFTNIQKIYLRNNGSSDMHYTQSMVVESKLNISKLQLHSLLKQLAIQHDMLRSVFQIDFQGVITQTILPVSELTILEPLVETCNSVSEVEDYLFNVQSLISIEKGIVFATGLFEFKNQQHLFFTIHHLVVDLVSWRIIFEDIELLLNKQPLPDKTMSFQEWSNQLDVFSRDFASDWKEHLRPIVNTIQSTLISKSKMPMQITSIDFTVSEEFTSLLDQANLPFETNIQDVIIASMIQSLTQLAGENSSIRFHLESHGRNPWEKDLDISRTVGWFTSIFPVAFDVESDILKLLPKVKSVIRSVPNKGVDYNSDYNADKEEVVIAFNYLGRFQQFENSKSNFSIISKFDQKDTGKGYVSNNDVVISAMHEGSDLIVSGDFNERVSKSVMTDWFRHSKEIFQRNLICLSTQKPFRTLEIKTSESNQSPNSHSKLQEKFHLIKALFEKEMQERKIPGLAFAMVTKDEAGTRQTLTAGIGKAVHNKSKFVDSNSLFGVGSLSKFILAVAIGQMVDERKLDFYKPVKEYFPQFKLTDEYATANTTLIDLLSHRTGVPTANFAHAQNWDIFTAMEQISYAPLVGEFGKSFNYQNTLVAFAATLLGGSKDDPFEEYKNRVQEMIFKPLGMNDTTVDYSAYLKSNNRSIPHKWSLDKPDPIEQYPDNINEDAKPSGSVITSISDYAKWLEFIIDMSNNAMENPIVSKKVFDTITSPHNGEHGLGVMSMSAMGHKLLYHDGSVYGFKSIMFAIPELDFAFALFTNADQSLGSLNELLPDIYNILFNQEVELKKITEERYKLLKNIELAGLKSNARNSNIKNTLPLSEYCGVYSHSFYDQFILKELTTDGFAFAMHIGKDIYHFIHYECDSFVASTSLHQAIIDPTFKVQFKIVNGKVVGFESSSKAFDYPIVYFEKIVKEYLEDVQSETSHITRQGSVSSFNSVVNEIDDYLKETKLATRYEFKQRHLKVVCLCPSHINLDSFIQKFKNIVELLGSVAEFSYIVVDTSILKGKSWYSKLFKNDQKAKLNLLMTRVYEKLVEIGKVDAILGFADAAALIEILDGKVQSNEIAITWNFSILLSGSPVKSKSRCPHPATALIVNGEKEGIKVRTGLLDRYNVLSREHLEHNSGQEIPQNTEFIRKFADKIFRMAINERKRERKSSEIDIVTSAINMDYI